MRNVLCVAVALLAVAQAGAASADVSPPEVAYVRDGDVWVGNADGSGARRLTSTGAESMPTWSPDGSQLAFVSYRGDASRSRSALYVMNSGGDGVRRINEGWVVRFLGAPVWSPDGRQIAVLGIRDGGAAADVLLVAADGSASRWLTDTGPQESAVQWSGTDRVVYGGIGGIFEVSTSDGRSRLLVPDGYAPALSPDRSRLAYVVWRGAFRTLHVADAAGRNPRAFLPEREHAAGPIAWSPDGTRIAFTGQFSLGYSRYGEGFANHLWHTTQDVDRRYAWAPDGRRLVYVAYHPRALVIVSLAGSSHRILHGTRRGGAHQPDWSPDGRSIAFLRQKAPFGGADLYVVAPDGSGLRPLVRSRSDLKAPTWAPDGRSIAYFRLVDDTPGSERYAVVVADRDGGRRRRLGVTSTWDSLDWSPDSHGVLWTDYEKIYVARADGRGRPRLVATGQTPDWG